ncbi:hypothetical protein BU15DRAFT_67523 [Melanogaster broomeanus]|nr:hypothetical protein BU15DRAFT_67523 [Melanogaster broomeanus]
MYSRNATYCPFTSGSMSAAPASLRGRGCITSSLGLVGPANAALWGVATLEIAETASLAGGMLAAALEGVVVGMFSAADAQGVLIKYAGGWIEKSGLRRGVSRQPLQSGRAEVEGDVVELWDDMNGEVTRGGEGMTRGNEEMKDNPSL